MTLHGHAAGGNKMNIPLRILCGRSGMLGDTVSALPIATYFRKLYPTAHLIWPIGKKFAQGAPLYINQGIINEIFVLDGDEKPESKRDWDMVNSCGVIVNPTPDHPDNRYPNEFTIYSESWRMAGLSMDEWNKLSPEEQRPKLYKWWIEEPKLKKTIALWPCAGYGRENKRNPSEQWYRRLVSKLIIELGYKVLIFGHPNDFDLGDLEHNRELSFFDQIKKSLRCDLVIGTDSGSGLIIGAYEMNQITLLTDHWGNTNNPYALAPNNVNNDNFFTSGGCDNIKIDEVVEKIKEKLQ